MNKIKQLMIGLALVTGIAIFATPSYAGAVSAIEDTCADPLNKDTVICKNKNNNVRDIIGTVVNTLLFLIGVAAVIVIIIGGFTYVTSGGSDANVKRAKDMILYAVIGLVIAFAAYAIVNWVIKAFG